MQLIFILNLRDVQIQDRRHGNLDAGRKAPAGLQRNVKRRMLGHHMRSSRDYHHAPLSVALCFQGDALKTFHRRVRGKKVPVGMRHRYGWVVGTKKPERQMNRAKAANLIWEMPLHLCEKRTKAAPLLSEGHFKSAPISTQRVGRGWVTALYATSYRIGGDTLPEAASTSPTVRRSSTSDRPTAGRLVAYNEPYRQWSAVAS